MQRKFYIAGVKFHSLPKIINEVEVGEQLTLTPEPTNKFDPNAVQIRRGNVFCGFVPKKFSAEIAGLIELGTHLTCTITIANPSAKTWEMCEVVIEDVIMSEDTHEQIRENYEAEPDVGDGPDYDTGCKEDS